MYPNIKLFFAIILLIFQQKQESVKIYINITKTVSIKTQSYIEKTTFETELQAFSKELNNELLFGDKDHSNCLKETILTKTIYKPVKNPHQIKKTSKL